MPGEDHPHGVAVDCSLAIHPTIVAQQMEGGVIFGLAAALAGKIDIRQGRGVQGNFHDYPVLRAADAPKVETIIVGSNPEPGAELGGIGEVATPPIAPALGNALFALTEQRMHERVADWRGG